MALALLTLVALHAYLGFTIYQMFRVALSERGVSLPTWRGRRLVPQGDDRRARAVRDDVAIGEVVELRGRDAFEGHRVPAARRGGHGHRHEQGRVPRLDRPAHLA